MGRSGIEVLGTLTEALVVLDPEWCCLFANRQAEELLAAPGKKLVGRSLWDFLPVPLADPLRAVASTRTAVDLRVPASAGSRRLLASVLPSTDGFLVLFRELGPNTAEVALRAEHAELELAHEELQATNEALNVTVDELRQANDALRQRESELQQLREEGETIRRVGQSVAAELDLQQLVQTVTDAATELTGAEFGSFFYNVIGADGEAYTLYTLSGVPREAFANFPMPRNTEVFAPTFHGSGVVRLDDVTRDPRYGKNPPYHGMPQGHLPVRSYLAVPVVSRSGEVLGGLFFGHSTPGQFHSGHERMVVGIAAQAAVGIDNARLYEQARRVEAELRRANETKDEFLAMLAHELRNPLAPILTAVQILRRHGTDEDLLRRNREVIARQVHHMARLTDDLLDVSRITRRKIRIQPEYLDFTALVRNCLEDHRDAIEAAGLTLSSDLPEMPLYVEGDPTRLSQVTANLLSNAIKFSNPEGRIGVHLSGEPEHHRVVLRVEDTGVGITPELLAHVWDAFTQEDRSLDRSRGGLGLGLALVRGLVELHGGEAWAESDGEGRGAAFSIGLPAAEPPPEPEASPEEDSAGTHRGRILVVDDNTDAADTLHDLLRIYDYDVEVAYSGPDALEAARRFRPDVVLCDIGLPGMDGFAVAQELRRHPTTAKAHLIAVTGYGQDEDQRRTQAAGFSHHLIKPVDPDRLCTLLEELAGES